MQATNRGHQETAHCQITTIQSNNLQNLRPRASFTDLITEILSDSTTLYMHEAQHFGRKLTNVHKNLCQTLRFGCPEDIRHLIFEPGTSPGVASPMQKGRWSSAHNSVLDLSLRGFMRLCGMRRTVRTSTRMCKSEHMIPLSQS